MALACVVAMTACGSSPPTAVTPAGRTAVRAPTCVHDDAFAAKQPGPEIFGAFAFQGHPIWPVIDRDTSDLVLRDLATSEEHARVAIPTSGSLLATSTLALPGGPAVVVLETPPEQEDESQPTDVVWLVPFEGGIARAPFRLPLPPAYTLTESMLAVGDHLVVLRRAWLDEELADDAPTPDDATLVARDAKRPATLFVLDGTRRIVHTSEVVGANGLIPIDGDTFAVTRATGEPGSETVRVFDLHRRAWGRDEVRTPWLITTFAQLGSHMLLVGTKPNPADVNAQTYALATFSADGTMSPWQPTTLAGWAASVAVAPEFGGALLVVMHAEEPTSDNNALRIVAVSPDLATSEVTRAESPRVATGSDAFMIGDDLYVAGFNRVAKYTCR